MPLQELNRTAQRQFVGQTRTRAIGVDTSSGDNRLAIMDSLNKFASAGSAEATRSMRAEIETKKALGASRAAQDLITSEQNRQGITEDDVLATKLSYNAIVGQHDTMNAGNKFVEWYKANPEADEEQIAERKTALYQPLFEKYGGDAQSVKQISLQVQESQFGLSAIQERVKQGYRVEKNTEALTMSVDDMLSDPQVNVSGLVSTEIPAQAKALGLDEFTYKKILMTEMNTRAENGDARLLNELGKTDWSKGSALIKNSRTKYDNFVAKENAVLIGDTMGSIEMENTSLNVPWSTTLKKIENLNKRFPDTYTDVRIASLKKARGIAQSAADKNKEMNKESFKVLYDESGLPLSMNGKFTPSDKKAHVKSLEGYWSKKTQDMIAGGADETTANSIIMKERLDWSRSNRMVIPSLKSNLDGLLSLNPEDYPNSNDLPEFANQGFTILKTMDTATMSLYFSGEDLAMAQNIKDAMGTRGNYSAYKRAYNVKSNPYRVSNDKRVETSDAVANVLNDKFEKGFFSRNLFNQKSVPEWQLEQIKSSVDSVSTVNLYNGMTTPESNAEQSVSEVTKDYSQTFNGTLINKPLSLIGSKLGLEEAAYGKVNDYLEAFVLSNKEYIKGEAGEEVEPEDISIDVNESGTSFILRNKGGEQVGGRQLFSEVQEVGRKADLQKLRDLRTESIDERNARIKANREAEEEAAHMVLFYEWTQQPKE